MRLIKIFVTSNKNDTMNSSKNKTSKRYKKIHNSNEK